MNLKNCKYMEGAEFKERQDQFSFFCEAAYEYIKQFVRECRAGWRELFRTGRKIPVREQLKLNFLGWVFCAKAENRLN